jgi:hypothetical protein
MKMPIILAVALLIVSIKNAAMTGPVEADSSGVKSATPAKTGKPRLAVGNNDTNPILEEDRAYNHAIYIEKNRNSEFYKQVGEFPDNRENYYFAEGSKPLGFSVSITSENRIPAGLPKEWVPLYRYKGSWYIYAPCDWGTFNQRALLDGAVIFWSMMGPSPQVFSSIKKTGEREYRFIFGNSKSDPLLVISILDTATGMSLWEYPEKGDWQGRPQVYIPKESVKKFPLIVNSCKGGKVNEFKFDEIDYLKLKASVNAKK